MLSERSKKLFPYFEAIDLKKKRNTTIMNDILGELFNNMNESDNFVKNVKKLSDVEESYTINVDNVSDIPKPDNFENTIFLPNTISTEILKNTEYVFCYKYNVLGRKIKINFGVEKKNDIKLIDAYKTKILMWLYIVNLYSSKKCSKNLNIYIYLNHQEKKLPNEKMETLSSNHVNSAFTSCCSENSEIVIFRKEEWFKVFIHETMHNFGLDFCNMESKKMKELMSSVFNLESNMLMYESYCEFWGIIMNCCFVSYLSNKKITKKEFIKNTKKNIDNEVVFSLFQMNKILDHMGLDYEDLYKKEEENRLKRNYLYREDTNVFAYYIVKTVLLYHYDIFLEWCSDKNYNLIDFKKTTKNVELFCEFIKKHYKKRDFLENYKKIGIVFDNLKEKKGNKILNDTTKMSLLEMK